MVLNYDRVVKVPEDELGKERIYKEAVKAEKRGKKLAFDLRGLDRKAKVDFIMKMNSLS